MKRGMIGHLAMMLSGAFGAMGNNTPKVIDGKRAERLERYLESNPEPVLSHGKRKFLINGDKVVYAISEKHAKRKFKKQTGSTINTFKDVTVE